MRDVTAQSPCSPAEYARLVRSEALYRHLVEGSLGLICSHDLTGRLLTVNAAAAQTLGYAPAELVGMNLADLVPPPQRHLFQPYLDRIRRFGKSRGYLDLTTSQGRIVTWLYRNQLYVESEVEPVVIGHALDITWRLQMERTLRESGERFRVLFEDAPVAYHEINSFGVITRVNRAECDLLGRTKSELIGTRVWDLVAEEQREQSRAGVIAKLSGSQPLVPFFRDYLRKDGSRVSAHIYERLIRSSSGSIIGIRSTLLDVTPQVRIESELRELNAELDRRVVERTAELHATTERLKEFVYTVSHDLQEPLRSIASFTSLLRTRYAANLDADGLEFLDYVTSGADRMSALIKDLLAYSRVLHEESVALEPVDLQDVLDSVMRNLSTAIDTGKAVIYRSTLPVVLANGPRMLQLFQNLLSNAIKYRSERHLRVDISATLDGSTCEIVVVDNGIGIAPEDRERVFGLFRRGRGSSGEKGAGVGLAICRAIVERHGGRIWVEPAPGGGSAFHFTLEACGPRPD